MYSSGVPEKLIAETSGRNSTKTLRMYEHTTESQYQSVGGVISDPFKQFTTQENLKPAASSATPRIQQFGSLLNCTLNVT